MIRLVIFASLLFLWSFGSSASAQEAEANTNGSESEIQATDAKVFVAVRTDSPRRTLISFLRLREQLEIAMIDFQQEKSPQSQATVVALLEELAGLIDLSDLPSATVRETSIDTVGYLLDIMGRVQLPAMQDMPRSVTDAGEKVNVYRLPWTPLLIELVPEGDLAGEYLFSARTVRSAPRFYIAIQNRQLKTRLEIESWSDTLPQLTGWAIPTAVDRAVPEFLKRTILGTPAWKTLAVLLAAALALWLFRVWFALVRSLSSDTNATRHFVRILAPLGAFPIVLALSSFFRSQINIGGTFANIVDSLLTLTNYLALTAVVWLCSIAFFEALLLGQRVSQRALNANLLRLLSRLFGVLAGVVVLAIGAQKTGVPVFSIIAGLGVGGLAIALALRPTIENLIGGILLYLDKPVRVGDFCTLGGISGTIEDIGVRSTHVRALDGTRISIPNAQFADIHLANWSACKEMQIQYTIGLRYETNTDQLRYVLLKLREMAQAYPRINGETARIRAIGFGSSSLDIEIRVYAKTKDWNEYFEIREYLVFKTKEIVEASGTSFAFPSMTLYSTRDKGLDIELSNASIKQVEEMRRRGEHDLSEIIFGAENNK